MQGREAETDFSRDWTPALPCEHPAYIPSLRFKKKDAAQCACKALPSKHIVFYLRTVWCVPSDWPEKGPGQWQGTELLETISSASGCIATFSHRYGCRWHQFLEKHQKRYRKGSLTFEPGQIGEDVIKTKISGHLEKYNLLGMITPGRLSMAFAFRRSALLSLENCKGINKPVDKGDVVDTDCLDFQKCLPKG